MWCISLAGATASGQSNVLLRRACQPNLIKSGSSLQVGTFNFLLRFITGDNTLCRENPSVDTHWLNELAVLWRCFPSNRQICKYFSYDRNKLHSPSIKRAMRLLMFPPGRKSRTKPTVFIYTRLNAYIYFLYFVKLRDVYFHFYCVQRFQGFLSC